MFILLWLRSKKKCLISKDQHKCQRYHDIRYLVISEELLVRSEDKPRRVVQPGDKAEPNPTSSLEEATLFQASIASLRLSGFERGNTPRLRTSPMSLARGLITGTSPRFP